jgi:hypothetical protein
MNYEFWGLIVNLAWIILAEGFGTASNGAVTAIGINQQVIIAPSLPITTKRGVLARFIDDSGTLAGQELEVTLTINDPAGRALLTQTAPARMVERPAWPELPSGVDVFLEIPLRLSDYGSYEVSLSLKPPNEDPVVGQVSFYVKEAIPSSQPV